MARRYYSTTAQRTTLASSCTDSGTTIVVTAATGFPATTPFPLVLDADTVNEEAVLVTSRVGTTCTVTRAYDGTTGVAHSAGATVRHAALALDFNEASEHVNETTTAHGLTLANVVLKDATQTLTNKTLTTPTIGSMVNANHDHSAGAGGGVLPASSVLNRPINAQSGTTYTFALADASKHVTGSSGSSSTFTIPLQASVTWLSDARIPVTNVGSGVMTLAITGGGTLNGADLTIAQGESVLLLRTASDVWWCLPFSTGSGAVARGTLSGTTGSPSTGSNGGATYYQFNSSGSATVNVAGLFDLLVVGGGGGAGYGSGGGAGQHMYLTSVYLPAGAYTVTVGAGGTGGTAALNGNGGYSAFGSIVAAGGGGGSYAASGTVAGGNGASGGGSSGLAGTGAGGLSVTNQYAGGSSNTNAGGGGGGSSAVGANATASNGGAGGNGTANSITGSSVTRAGGGGGAGSSSAGAAGTGGGGAGSTTAGNAATANTGSGGGAGWTTGGGNGGSGVVILLVGTV